MKTLKPIALCCLLLSLVDVVMGQELGKPNLILHAPDDEDGLWYVEMDQRGRIPFRMIGQRGDFQQVDFTEGFCRYRGVIFVESTYWLQYSELTRDQWSLLGGSIDRGGDDSGRLPLVNIGRDEILTALSKDVVRLNTRTGEAALCIPGQWEWLLGASRSHQAVDPGIENEGVVAPGQIFVPGRYLSGIRGNVWEWWGDVPSEVEVRLLNWGNGFEAPVGLMGGGGVPANMDETSWHTIAFATPDTKAFNVGLRLVARMAKMDKPSAVFVGEMSDSRENEDSPLSNLVASLDVMTARLDFNAVPVRLVKESLERLYNIQIAIPEDLDLDERITMRSQRMSAPFAILAFAHTLGLELNKGLSDRGVRLHHHVGSENPMSPVGSQNPMSHPQPESPTIPSHD